MADFQNNIDAPEAARVNTNRDLVIEPNLWKWAVQGKVFHAGFGMEDADGEENASGTAFDDTKATFALVAPSSSTVLVIPILFRLMPSSDGGGASQFQVCYTKPAGLCATSLAVSGGTAMTFKQPVYAKNPALSSPQSSVYYGDTITVSALTNVDYVSAVYGHIVDAALTTGLPTGGSPSYATANLLEGGPNILTAGAAMLVYFITASSDAVASCYIKWAEVSVDDLI